MADAAKKLTPLTRSPRYVAYMASRDRALEKFLQKYLNHLGGVITTLKSKSKDAAVLLTASNMSHYDAKKQREAFQKRVDIWFTMAALETTQLMTRLRRTTYALSFAGHSEAMQRAGVFNTRWKLSRQDVVHASSKDAPSGGKLEARIQLSYSRLLGKVCDAFQHSVVMLSGDPQNRDADRADMLARIDRAFPRQRSDTKPQPMVRMREAAGPLIGKPGLNDGVGLSTGAIDPDEWDQILEDYFTEQFPPDSPNRTVYSRVFYSEEPEDPGRYEWEIEAEASNDFVQSVRDGENDAAKAQGIDDFQWLAIVDSKTDDCCLWRDGLATEEIIAQLEDEHSDDDCQAVTCPAHPFCRCRMVPMTVDMPEPEKSELPNFEDWLEAKGKEAA